MWFWRPFRKFNQFPSELLGTLKIYKIQQADLIEGGVSSQILIGPHNRLTGVGYWFLKLEKRLRKSDSKLR